MTTGQPWGDQSALWTVNPSKAPKPPNPYTAKIIVGITVAVVFVVLVITLIVNAAGNSDSTTTTTPQQNLQDSTFLTVVNQSSALAQYPNDTLIQSGHWVCSQRENGYSANQVVASESQHLPYSEAVYLVRASEDAYCRDYK